MTHFKWINVIQATPQEKKLKDTEEKLRRYVLLYGRLSSRRISEMRPDKIY